MKENGKNKSKNNKTDGKKDSPPVGKKPWLGNQLGSILLFIRPDGRHSVCDDQIWYKPNRRRSMGPRLVDRRRNLDRVQKPGRATRIY